MKKVLEFSGCILAHTVSGTTHLLSGSRELTDLMDENCFDDACMDEGMKTLPTDPGVYSATIEYWFSQGYFEGYPAPGESDYDFRLSNLQRIDLSRTPAPAEVEDLAKNYSTQRRFFMIKTDPTMLVYNATKQPWTDDYGVIVSPYREHAICNLEPRDYKIENAMLICAAPPLLKVAQKLLLWMEECMAECDFNQDDIDLYHELRQTIRTAGGFSSETHWWQGPCICDACGHAWQGVVEIPIESTYPQAPLECGECHQMTGGPA